MNAARLRILVVRGAAVVASCAALAACAHDRPVLAQTGRIGAGSFALAALSTDLGAAERQKLEGMVTRKLADAGLTPAPLASADYVVDVGVTLTPQNLGVFEAAAGADTPPVETWTVQPQRRDFVRVKLVMTDRKTGKRVYQASAGQRNRPSKSPVKSAERSAALEAALVAVLPAAVDAKP